MRGASGDGDLLAALPTLSRTFGLGEVRDRTFLVHGLMNRNWRVETAAGTYAVKEITDVPLPRMRRNLAVLADLAGEGFPVPEPLTAEGGDLVAEVGGRGYCVLPWVEGDHVPGTELALDQARDLGALLARLLARHAGRRPTGEVPAGPYGWTHGDFQYRNMLREGGDVVAVLDWDRLGVRPYGEEVARTAQVQFGVGGVFDLDRVAAFTAGYRSVIGLSEADLAEAVTRLWWKRMTDFWQLELYLDRQDPAFRAMFLSDEALLHWWTDRADEVQVAYATR
ncbi:phosphotransferase [Streptomyces sp. NBC_01551]|uniref:phosphotransferase n=1 Tax=Streptomyces sp. NBC_01551 TaxID=2975876 RepID=UPI002253A062|nr:phosphotransferase [Streptomyces sp. NBC_01551]MCX4529879.1 phosphotransferase [Streptomyces sp. NBC_01551]